MKHSKEKIIHTGQDLFRKYGYHATGISLILSECSISKGTFYNYFESKEKYAVEVIQNYSFQIQKLIQTYMGFQSMPASKRLKRYFEQLARINQSEGANLGCLLMNFMTELAGQDDLIAKVTNDEFEKWIFLLIPTIEEAQQKKQITQKHSSKQIAIFIYTHQFGEFSIMKSSRSIARMDTSILLLFELLKGE